MKGINLRPKAEIIRGRISNLKTSGILIKAWSEWIKPAIKRKHIERFTNLNRVEVRVKSKIKVRWKAEVAIH